MRDTETYTGTISGMNRLPSSRNGNPRFLVTIHCDSGEILTARTMPDSMDGYTVRDFEGEHVTAAIGWHYGKLSIADIQKTGD